MQNDKFTSLEKSITAVPCTGAKHTKSTPWVSDMEQIYNDRTPDEGDNSESGPGSESADADGDKKTVDSLSATFELTEADVSMLYDAIESAPRTRLQAVLKYVCEKNEIAKQLAAHRLLVPVGTGDSRKQKRFELCGICGKEYDVCSNVQKLCTWGSEQENPCTRFHPGKTYRRNGELEALFEGIAG